MVVGDADPRIAAATKRRFRRLPCISGIWAVFWQLALELDE
jgi:hypothetical protein